MDDYISTLSSQVTSIGGIVWTTPYILNLVAYRDISNPDTWNDKLIYFYYDESKGLHYNEVLEFTTDPGIEYLRKPINSKGCAILTEGWHRRIWVLGTHNGYPALQQYSPCSVYRDNDRDAHPDRDRSTIDTGMFGIDLHRANQNSIAPSVGKHSAGCCVIRRIDQWNEFLHTCQLCKEHGQKYFSISIFNK